MSGEARPDRRLVAWLRTGSGRTPRLVRSVRRRQREILARRRHGSVTAHMDAIVAEAIDATKGSGRPRRGGARS